MKKILAMLLAVLMLLGMTALAETAEPEAVTETAEASEAAEAPAEESGEAAEAPAVESGEAAAEASAAEAVPAVNDKPALLNYMYNIVINTTDAAGNVKSVSLDDLELNLVVDTTNELQFVASAYKGEENLAFAVLRLVNDRFRLSLKGVNRTFEIDVPQLEGQDTSAIPGAVRAMLPFLMGARMPMIDVPALPKADLGQLLQLYATETTESGGVSTTSFEISEEATRALIQMLNGMLKTAASEQPNLQRFSGLIDQILASGVRVSVGGTIKNSLAAEDISLGIYLAPDEEAPEAPTFILNTHSALNEFRIAFDLPDENSTYTVAQLTINTDPVGDTINANISAIDMLNIDANVLQHDGLQEISLSSKVVDKNGNVVLNYGTVDGLDHISVSGNMDGMGDFQCTTEAMMNDDGNYVGMQDWRANYGGNLTNTTMDFYEVLDNYDMGGYNMPTRIVSIEDMSQAEITAAFQPLMDALTSAMGMEAPAAEAGAEGEAPVAEAGAEGEAPADGEAAEVEPAA